MFSEAKVTEIYCLADDFCKEFAKYQENHIFPNSPKNGKHRNKPNRMSDAEIMLIMILFHSGHERSLMRIRWHKDNEKNGIYYGFSLL